MHFTGSSTQHSQAMPLSLDQVCRLQQFSLKLRRRFSQRRVSLTLAKTMQTLLYGHR